LKTKRKKKDYPPTILWGERAKKIACPEKGKGGKGGERFLPAVPIKISGWGKKEKKGGGGTQGGTSINISIERRKNSRNTPGAKKKKKGKKTGRPPSSPPSKERGKKKGGKNQKVGEAENWKKTHPLGGGFFPQEKRDFPGARGESFEQWGWGPAPLDVGGGGGKKNSGSHEKLSEKGGGEKKGKQGGGGWVYSRGGPVGKKRGGATSREFTKKRERDQPKNGFSFLGGGNAGFFFFPVWETEKKHREMNRTFFPWKKKKKKARSGKG